MGSTNRWVWAKRPRQLTEVVGQSRIIDTLLSFLRTDDIPPALLAQGPGGCGKTTTISAFIRTLLCHNRPLGGTTACLECESCRRLEDPKENNHPDVIWVQTGKGSSKGEDSLNTQLNYALERVKEGPNVLTEKHRNYLVVVIDEVQNLPVNLLQRLFFMLEAFRHLEQYRVLFIFSTMNPSRIHSESLGSFIGRVWKLNFKAPSIDELLQVSRQLAPQAEDIVHLMLADHVYKFGGGYRELVKLLEGFGRPEFGYSYELIKEYLGYPSIEELDNFWRLCSRYSPGRGGATAIREYFNYLLGLCHHDQQKLWRLLLENLTQHLDKSWVTERHLQVLEMIATALYYPECIPEWVLAYCYGLPFGD